MCTVTFLPLGNNDFILTSNRDETPLRKTISPTSYDENGTELIYPKDELAGGTWIGISDKKRLVCLLNGGFEKHQRNQYYKMSRGVIVKNILSADNGIGFINDFDFKEIEPFTIVLVDWKNQIETYELVWDGKTKHVNKLEQEPKIWSSSALYTAKIKEVREEWFVNWLNNNNEFHQEKIIEFHQNEKLGTPDISLKMKRDFVETVSVTSVKKIASVIEMTYLDLLKTNKVQKKSIQQ